MQDIAIIESPQKFWDDLQAALSVARDRAYIQAMTFEADSIGLAVAKSIIGSPASDRRVLVDDYTFHVINDRIVRAPWNLKDETLQAEMRATYQMFRDFGDHNVSVRRTNPIGFLWHRYPARNHKKFMVVDSTVWFGGVNFSDHNFAWHDIMFRIDDRRLADFFSADFLATYNSTPCSGRIHAGAVEIMTLDGKNNLTSFAYLREIIDSAQSRIIVLSPYLTAPVIDWLLSAAKRGITVQVLTPRDNNKPLMTAYLRAKLHKSRCQLIEVPGMSHAKCILVDGGIIIEGSSIFDLVSLRAEEEVIAIIRDETLIRRFETLVLTKLQGVAAHHREHPRPRLRDRASVLVIALLSILLYPFRYCARQARNVSK